MNATALRDPAPLPSRPRPSNVARWVQSPGASLALLALLAALVCVVPHDWRHFGVVRGENEVVGLAALDPYAPELVLVENGVARFERPGIETEGDAWSYAATHNLWIAKVSYRSAVTYVGFFGFTRRIEHHLLTFDPESGPEARIAMAALLAEWDRAGGMKARAAAEMRDFVGERSRPLPWGYWHNAMTVATALAVLPTLGWIPRVLGERRSRRRDRLLSRDICPSCRYGLSGASRDVCPECGAVLRS